MPATPQPFPADFFEPGEPPACRVMHAEAPSPFLLICDHASARVPRRLGTLGLPRDALLGHIGWDIGAAQVAQRMGEALGATVILQNYSRLVIDCNRPLGTPGSIPAVSDTIPIPGNAALSTSAADARAAAIFHPYHERIRQALDAQPPERPPVLVSVHSFTPVLQGFIRPWHVGTLYHRDARLAHELLRVLRRNATLVVGDNEPYAATTESDYAIPQHGEARQLLHVGIEIRQDLLDGSEAQDAWATRLAVALKQSLDALAPAGGVR